MSSEESAVILRALIANHPSLDAEVEAMAADTLSTSPNDNVADDVFKAVSSLGIEDMGSLAGRQPWGYVEPTEAAWELLQEAVEPFVQDMKRRAELGFDLAAVRICTGILAGLYRSDDEDPDCLVTFAPDFCSEHACYVAEELIRSAPPGRRKGVRSHLRELLREHVPEWHSMISGVVDRRTK